MYAIPPIAVLWLMVYVFDEFVHVPVWLALLISLVPALILGSLLSMALNYVSGESRTITLLEDFVFPLIIMFVISVPLYLVVFKHARERAAESRSMNNVKVMATALLAYAEDNRSGLALNSSTFVSTVSSYLPDNLNTEDFFHCSLSETRGVSYAFNDNLAGVALTKVAAPSQTVLIYEGSGGHLRFDPTDHTIVGYADGHVRLLDQDQARSLKWAP